MLPLLTSRQWVNLFPEIKDHLLHIFERYCHVLDAELQQRACEYLALARRDDNDELLQAVWDEMPPFPERESALLHRLHKKGEATQDKRTWIIGGKGENQQRQAARHRSFTASSRDAPEIPPAAAAAATTQPAEIKEEEPEDLDLMGASGDGGVMDELARLNLGGDSVQEASLLANEQPVANAASPPAEAPRTISTSAALAAMSLTKGTGIEKWLERLSYNSEGVLFEDEQMQVGIKAEYHDNAGRIALYIGNKVTQPFTSFSAKIDCPDEASLSIDFHKQPPNEIAGLTQVQSLLQIECKGVFAANATPIIRLSFIAGTVRNVALRLPIFLSKFIEPVQLEAGPFFERWKIIGGPPRESQLIFPITLLPDGQVDLARNTKVVGGQKLALLGEIDKNPNNLVAAGVLHTTGGKM